MSQKVFGSRPRYNGFPVLLDDGTVGAASGITGQTLTSNTVAANSVGSVFADVSTANSCALIINPATYSAGAQVVFESSRDNGVTYAPHPVIRSDTGFVATSHYLSDGSASKFVKFDASCIGIQSIRMRIVTTFSTSVTLAIQPSAATLANPVVTDGGRQHICYYAARVTCNTSGAETFFTVNQTKASSANGSATAWNLTNGKRFRMTAIQLGRQASTSVATLINTVFRMRFNPNAGGVTTSSAVVWEARAATHAALGAYGNITVPIPEGGFDIEPYYNANNGAQFGFTHTSTYNTNPGTVDICVFGYEYSASA